MQHPASSYQSVKANAARQDPKRNCKTYSAIAVLFRTWKNSLPTYRFYARPDGLLGLRPHPFETTVAALRCPTSLMRSCRTVLLSVGGSNCLVAQACGILFLLLSAPRRIARPAASSLRDHRRCAPVSNFADAKLSNCRPPGSKLEGTYPLAPSHAARRSALFHIPLNPRRWTLPECARPIMLKGANSRDNGDKERCRPPKQD